MPVEKTYGRLGLFIVVTLVVVLVTAVFFIQRLKHQAAIAMVTYTTENVFGLDVSSAVRLRGVPVGRVTEIRADPMGQMVEIDFELYLQRLNTIGLDVKRLRTITDFRSMSPNLRAQIMGNPMTGQAYLLLNRMENPPPAMELNFKPTRAYVPSAPSPITMIQDRLPELLDRADTTFQTLTEVVARMPSTLERSDRFLRKLEGTIHESDLPALSADTRKFYARTSSQIEQMRAELNGVIGPQGTLVKLSEEARSAVRAADLPATAQSAREAADNSRLATDDLRRSLPTLRDSVERLRDLTRAIEEQPESVVYGQRTQEKKPQ
ncbi:MAG TPA: MlaD family protein [Candidatus Sulfotelmatobacter sp.]|nr:MlaD family protein [Candidatus Sulfotelmatobacter sp.]